MMMTRLSVMPMSLIVSLTMLTAEVANVCVDQNRIIALGYDLTDIPETRFQTVRAGVNGQPYFCAYLKIELHLEKDLKVRVTHKGQELAVLTTERT
jgi:hypothetical protein